MGKTIRLTAAQAMVRWLAAQKTESGESFIAGCWAIFGHGNVAGLGEALHGIGDDLPTWRFMSELPYWIGRAELELGMIESGARQFERFLSYREGGALAEDARSRLP